MSRRRRPRWRRPELPPLSLPTNEQIMSIPKIVDNAGGSVLRIGLRTNFFADLYVRTLTVRWPVFLGAATAFYLIANVFFAGLYMLDLKGIAEARPGSFLDAFFFSVQ